MKRYVFDTTALMAYAAGENGSKKVAEIFKNTLDGKSVCYMSVINWGEIYSLVLKSRGIEQSELFRNTITKYPIIFVDTNQELILVAAKIKAMYDISFTTAFCVAVAKTKKAELVTNDKEFKIFEKEIKLFWI